jgi:carboxyl-terminal processing protease
VTQFRAALEATGAFPTFATEFLQRGRNVTADFEVSNQLLDDLQQFLSQRNIRPSLAEWSKEREWIRDRLKQEIFNQALGVEKGDEVEAHRDPVVIKALEVLGAR